MAKSEPALIASKQLLEDLLQEMQTNNKDLSVRGARDSLSNSLGLDGCGPGLSAEEQRLQADRWLSWARQKHQLKVVTAAVPVGILPKGRTAEMHDVKVFTKHGPDDAVYDASKEFREKVARGNCFLELPAGPDRGTYCVIHALKKFTGGLGDDDDKDRGDNHTWKRYFTKPLEEATTVVATRKANGEAAHLGARLVEGKVVLCGGSKNVHMLFTQRGHIEKYKDSRYQVAREVCTAIMDLLDDMSDLHRQRLQSFLVHTGYTAVFEVLQPHHQHVEDLSDLQRSELRFIAWTSTDLEPRSNAQLCSMAPHMAIEIARTLGLPTVQYELVPASEVETRMKEIRQGYGYEGEVLYFLDADGAVIGLLKKKTIWYIVIRAIREKVRAAAQAYNKKKDFDFNRSDKKVRQRIGEIQQWLGLDDESVAAWRDLAHKFLHWVIKNLRTRTVTMEEVMIDDRMFRSSLKYPWNMLTRRFRTVFSLHDAGSSSVQLPEGATTTSDGLTQSIRKNGRFVNPWPDWALPSFTGTPNMLHLMWKFTTGSGDRSSIPSQEVLDTTLPVVTPDFSSPAPVDGMRVTWLGHSSVLVQFENICVLTDPIVSQRCAPFQFPLMGPKRYRGPPCTVEDLPSVDVVVISHDHYDHLDYNTVKDLHKRFGGRVSWHVPLGLSSWMKGLGCENVVEQDWWQEERVKDRDDIKVVFTPAAHWCKRGPNDDNMVLWGSWCVIGQTSRLFFGGDTGYCHGFKEIGKKYGPFDLAAIPIGAYEPREFLKSAHVNPAEAVQIHQDIQARHSLGIHWGTFALSFEGYLEPRSNVMEAMEANGLKVADFFTLDHGGSKVIPISQDTSAPEANIEMETTT